MFLKKFKNLYKFKPYFKKYKKLIIGLISVMLIASSTGVAISYLISEQLIGITNEITHQAITFTIYIMLAVTIHHINWFLWSKFHFKLTKKVAIDIRNDITNKLLDTKYLSVKDNTTGFYLERLNEDVTQISNFLGNVAGTLVDVFTNFSFLIIIYFLNWQIGLFFTIGVGLLFIIESIKVKKDLYNLELVKHANEKLSTEFNEIIHGIKDIKGFGLKFCVNKKLQKTTHDLLNKTCTKDTKFEFYSRIGTYLQWVIDSILVVLSMLWLLPSGQITIVVLLIVFNYKSLMYDTVGFFSKMKGYYVNCEFYAKRVLEIIDSENFEVFGNNNNTLRSGKIEIKNLNFSYGDKQILKSVNLTINPNSINALIGKSGSGKTTLFSLLAKYYETENGKIFFGGIDINDFSEQSLRNEICIVNQEPFVFSDTILNNLRIIKPNATLEEIYSACKKVNIHDEIMSMPRGYNTILTENGSNLSGGQKQRIELARAFLKDSKIILLDEPTSALDSINQEKFFTTLHELKTQKTIVIIAHNLASYENFDNVFVLEDGNIYTRN